MMLNLHLNVLIRQQLNTPVFNIAFMRSEWLWDYKLPGWLSTSQDCRLLHMVSLYVLRKLIGAQYKKLWWWSVRIMADLQMEPDSRGWTATRCLHRLQLSYRSYRGLFIIFESWQTGTTLHNSDFGVRWHHNFKSLLYIRILEHVLLHVVSNLRSLKIATIYLH